MTFLCNANEYEITHIEEKLRCRENTHLRKQKKGCPCVFELLRLNAEHIRILSLITVRLYTQVNIFVYETKQP